MVFQLVPELLVHGFCLALLLEFLVKRVKVGAFVVDQVVVHESELLDAVSVDRGPENVNKFLDIVEDAKFESLLLLLAASFLQVLQVLLLLGHGEPRLDAVWLEVLKLRGADCGYFVA